MFRRLQPLSGARSRVTLAPGSQGHRPTPCHLDCPMFFSAHLVPRRTGRVLAVALLAFLASACNDSVGPRPEERHIPVRLFPQYSDTVSEYSLVEASTSIPLALDLQALGVAGKFSSARFATGDSTLLLPRLSRDYSFQVVLNTATGAQRIISVRSAPPDFPAYTTQVGGAVSPGSIYTTATSTGFTGQRDYAYNLILAGDGTPTYYRHFDHGVTNFHKITYDDGTVRYAFMEFMSEGESAKVSANGDVVLLDEAFREIRRLRLLPYGNHGVLPADSHDFLIFDDDHYVLGSYQARTVDLVAYGGKQDSRVAAAVVQEVKNGAVVWEWDSTNYPQFYGASVEGNDYTNVARPLADYMHLNAWEYDASDRSYIISFRNIDALVKIAPYDVPAGTTIPIRWILGGLLDQFGLTAEQRFYRQHDPRVVNREGSLLTISLFNNNNGHYGEHASSAMVLELNEASRTARLVDEYADEMHSTSQGSVQVFAPKHYFIGWGSDNRITEVVNGQRVFTIDFADNLNVYRARKLH